MNKQLLPQMLSSITNVRLKKKSITRLHSHIVKHKAPFIGLLL
jgi:hypothetical protein